MTQDNYHIYSKRVFIDGALQPATLSIANGKIVAIHLWVRLKGAVSYGESVIMPGVIDAHVHINEPGRTDWEGFETATKAAARGGITTLVDMPLNSSPVVTNVAAFQEKLMASQNKLYVNCGFWAGATNTSIESVKALIEKGCLGVKVFLSHSGIDEFPNISLDDLGELMEGIQHLGVPVLAHCELDTLPADDSIKYTPRSYAAYLNSRPKTWENEAIRQFIALAEQYNCKAHIVHLASDEMIGWLAEKKQTPIPFTVETCPHYLFFKAETIPDGNTLYKCAPPIRAKRNGEHLKQALKSGVIDFIASDHSPAPPNIKELESGNFAKAWGGIAGLQFLLSASWTALKQEMTLAEFIPLLTSKPAQFLELGHKIGSLKEGMNADMTIWQPETIFKVSENIIEHRHKPTPYLGRTLYGKVDGTIVNGRMAFRGEVINSSPFGEKILRGK